MNSDPLIAHETQPTKTVAELVRADERLKEEFARITLPLLILHGTDDKAAKSSGSQLFYDRAGSTDKTLKLYDGHFHDLLNDLGKETVMTDITSWIDARSTRTRARERRRIRAQFATFTIQEGSSWQGGSGSAYSRLFWHSWHSLSRPARSSRLPGDGGDRCPHGNRGWRVGAVSERGQRSSDRTSARLRRNIAHVAAIDTAPGGDAHRDCTRSARDRRIGDSARRSGHDTRRRPHACAREKPRREQGGCRRTRHRIDGRLRVRRAVPRRRRQARAHGRVSARRRWLGDDLQQSCDLALPLQRAHAGGHRSRS